MAGVSGVGKLLYLHLNGVPMLTTAACVFGASIICVDLLVQYIPRCRNFRIQDSNSFLASSLSLSFGVMVRQAEKSF